MNCAINVTKYSDGAEIKNIDSGLILTMPLQEKWEYIRFRVKQGDRLSQAYDSAQVFRYLPPTALQPCIKAVYLTTDIDPNTRQRRDKPFGDGTWITEGFCNCMASSIEGGRIDLGDRFVVPSPAEQSCIAKAVYEDVISFSEAINICCQDIRPPELAIPYIANMVTTTSFTLYDIYKSARALHISGQFNPPPDETPDTPDTPNIPDTKKSNMLIYSAVAIGLLLIMRK